MEMAINSQKSVKRIHPKKFALWIALASIFMMFAAFTSALLVRKGAGNWFEFKVPTAFFISAALILASSIFLIASSQAFKNGNEKLYKSMLLAGFASGIAFLVSQVIGWQHLMDIGIFIDKNGASSSFFYMITIFHALHVVGGVVALALAIMHAFALPFPDKTTEQGMLIYEKRKLRFDITLTYWHFVDILWIYLLVFLITQQ